MSAFPFGDSLFAGILLPGKATPVCEADLSQRIKLVAVCVTPAGVQDVLFAGTPAGRKALKSPPRIATVGTTSLTVRPVRGRLYSCPPKKKSLLR
jgi:hypothetical protein